VRVVDWAGFPGDADKKKCDCLKEGTALIRSKLRYESPVRQTPYPSQQESPTSEHTPFFPSSGIHTNPLESVAEDSQSSRTSKARPNRPGRISVQLESVGNLFHSLSLSAKLILYSEADEGQGAGRNPVISLVDLSEDLRRDRPATLRRRKWSLKFLLDAVGS